MTFSNPRISCSNYQFLSFDRAKKNAICREVFPSTSHPLSAVGRFFESLQKGFPAITFQVATVDVTSLLDVMHLHPIFPDTLLIVHFPPLHPKKNGEKDRNWVDFFISPLNFLMHACQLLTTPRIQKARSGIRSR